MNRRLQRPRFILVCLFVVVIAGCLAIVEAASLNASSSACGYVDTCSVGGYTGVCVDVGSDCCTSGTVRISYGFQC
jgi:hypothetical protein